MDRIWAKPGVKCVCFRQLPLQFIKPGPTVYTIESAFICGGDLHLTFVGVENGGELAECFRPIVTRTQEQDVEMFLSLLNPSPLERLDRLMEIMNEQ